MREMHQAYSVQIYDSPLRWLVTKAQGDIGYLVELSPKDHRHKCGCKFHQYQKKDSIRQCRHVKKVIQTILEGYDMEDYGF